MSSMTTGTPLDSISIEMEPTNKAKIDSQNNASNALRLDTAKPDLLKKVTFIANIIFGLEFVVVGTAAGYDYWGEHDVKSAIWNGCIAVSLLFGFFLINRFMPTRTFENLILASQNERQKTQGLLLDMKQQNKKWKRDSDEANLKFANSQENLNRVTQSLNQAEINNKKYEEERKILQHSVDAYKSELEDRSKQISTLEARMKELESDTKNLDQNVHNYERLTQEASKEQISLEGELKQSIQLNESLKREYSELKKIYDDMIKANSDLTEERIILEERIKSLEKSNKEKIENQALIEEKIQTLLLLEKQIKELTNNHNLQELIKMANQLKGLGLKT